MGTLDDFTDRFGAEALRPQPTVRSAPQSWHRLCVCGHLEKYHSPDIGGTFALIAPTVQMRQEFTGCRGAIVSRGTQLEVVNYDRDRVPPLMLTTLLPTCPCVTFRPVVEVDRPNRYFNQRVGDRTNPVRHPFAVGIRAFTTHLSRRRAALTDPSWPAAEFERRFVWTYRRCDLSRCQTVEGVYPIYVDGDRSELRCEAHTPGH